MNRAGARLPYFPLPHYAGLGREERTKALPLDLFRGSGRATIRVRVCPTRPPIRIRHRTASSPGACPAGVAQVRIEFPESWPAALRGGRVWISNWLGLDTRRRTAVDDARRLLARCMLRVGAVANLVRWDDLAGGAG